MERKHAIEAAPIMIRALRMLLSAAPTRGRPGSDLRTACNDLIVRAEEMLQKDVAGPPLAACFNLARDCNTSYPQIAVVRNNTEAETPNLVGAKMVKDAIIQLCLACESRIVADLDFSSRDQVDSIKLEMAAGFDGAEEQAANEMDQETYRALVKMHGAIIDHLTDTARPLPRMLRFRFGKPAPTLTMAQRLYYDASRADELRAENSVVHPAFMRPTGRALSA